MVSGKFQRNLKFEKTYVTPTKISGFFILRNPEIHRHPTKKPRQRELPWLVYPGSTEARNAALRHSTFVTPGVAIV